MDLKKLGNILVVGGILVLVAAFIWWFSFYSSVIGEVARVPGGNPQVSVFDAKSCLYSSSDFCGLVAGGARLLGKTPYEPMAFWVGLAALVAGILVRVTAKPAGAK